jgi:hypothetical protein
MTSKVNQIAFLLYPERFVMAQLSFRVLDARAPYYTTFCVLLALGSFVFALPVLLVGASRK